MPRPAPRRSADIAQTLETTLDEDKREQYKRWVASLPRKTALPNAEVKPGAAGIPALHHKVDPATVQDVWTPYQ